MSKDIKEQLVPQVDIQRFMGDWHVIAAIPTMFENGVYNGLERYEWNSEEDRIDIAYIYNKDSFDGKVKEITQKGFVQDQGNGAYWKVQPIWPFKLGYLVIDLAEDYQWTVIGVPDKNYAWIMARTPEMDDEIYQKRVKRLEDLGYPMKKLKRVPQNGKKPVN